MAVHFLLTVKRLVVGEKTLQTHLNSGIEECARRIVCVQQVEFCWTRNKFFALKMCKEKHTPHPFRNEMARLAKVGCLIYLFSYVTLMNA
jgi:hypothetical protein